MTLLLKNAESNADAKNLPVELEDLYIKSIVFQQAPHLEKHSLLISSIVGESTVP